jgi:hypothetical protein
MTELHALIAAADPALAPYAMKNPGPGRFEGTDNIRGFVLESVYEGYLMHYDEPRAFTGMDDDLRLLAGDALYALGLARLAELGDLDAVAQLADVISLAAQAHAAGDPDLAHAAWRAGAGCIAAGAGVAAQEAKARARAGDPAAADALRAAADAASRAA